MPKLFFGNVGQSEAERKTQNRETAGVRKYGVHAVEQLKAEKTEHNRKGQKTEWWRLLLSADWMSDL